MAANQTRAQRARRFADAGIRMPNLKLTPEELQARLAQRSVKFADRRTARVRSRGDARRNAINNY